MLYNIPGAKRKTGYVHNRLNEKAKMRIKKLNIENQYYQVAFECGCVLE